MTSYDFDKAVQEWSKPPFTGYGYFSTQELLDEGNDDRIREMMDLAMRARYEGLGHVEWNDWMKYSETYDKTVLDFGCGTGCEALQYAKYGNRVILADIAEANVRFAEHIMRLYGFGHLVVGTVVLTGEYPFFRCTTVPREELQDVYPGRADMCPRDFDIFHSCGVLCATPTISAVMDRVHELMEPGQEARLMLYSEHSWHGENKAVDMDVTKEPPEVFEEYVRRMDTVGLFADWHSEERLDLRLNGPKQSVGRSLPRVGTMRKWDIEFHGVMSEISDFCISRLRRL